MARVNIACFGTRKVFAQHSLVKAFNRMPMVRLIRESVPKPHVTQTGNQHALSFGDRAKGGDLIPRDLASLNSTFAGFAYPR